MAQLRDVKTSEILFEGTPYEVVLMADKLGRDEVLFDDVGLGFDPDAVKAARLADAEALASIAKSKAKGVDDALKAHAKEAVSNHGALQAHIEDSYSDVEAALKEARARLEA